MIANIENIAITHRELIKKLKTAYSLLLTCDAMNKKALIIQVRVRGVEDSLIRMYEFVNFTAAAQQKICNEFVSLVTVN